ncbi:hypothetical protein V8G54_020425 [Vigna mungo]|uniref:Uncharacterized protein n=1 Tax=Vigna mungo TaxID=3915 RepID=A0AAQ3NBU0_VIGMU
MPLSLSSRENQEASCFFPSTVHHHESPPSRAAVTGTTNLRRTTTEQPPRSSRRSHNNHHAKHLFLFPITLCSITRSFHFGLESHIHEILHVFTLKLLFSFQ